MKSKIYLTGEDVHNVKVGQKVIIKFPTISDFEFIGKVVKINSSIDQMSKSLEAEITILTKDARIKSGMFGEFFIETKNIANSLVVPEVALIPQTEIKIDRETGLQNTFKKYYLFVVDKNRAKMKEVKTGIANNGQIEIMDGLNINDSVIIVGQNIVKEGQTVNVIE
jgi:membrane fusion protein, multidrug efflux system